MKIIRRLLMILSWKLIFVFLIFTFTFNEMKCEKRPFYNIAHMVNSIPEIDDYLRRGANSFETDISFLKNGTAARAFHGFPCDCFRNCDSEQDLGEFLEYVAELSNPKSSKFNSALTMIILDLKLASVPPENKYAAGIDLTNKLIQYLWKEAESKTHMNILMSIQHTTDEAFVRGVLTVLAKPGNEKYLDKIGWDISMNDPLTRIRSFYQKLGIKDHIWQGDGINNCLNYFRDLNRLKQCLAFRDAKPPTFVQRVYHWTLDLSVSLRKSLRLNVDGILTNYPERLKSILEEEEFKDTYRPATLEDNPWQRLIDVETYKDAPKDSVNRSRFETFKSVVSEVVTSAWRYLVNKFSNG